MRRALSSLVHSSRHALPPPLPRLQWMNRSAATLSGAPRTRKRPSGQPNPSAIQQLQATKPSNQKQQPPPRRVADPRIDTLLSKRTLPAKFAHQCQELRGVDPVELLTAAEPHVWNLALQHRLQCGDEDGAEKLLELLLSFDAENMGAKLWTGLLFTVMRQRSRLANEAELRRLLDSITRKCGDDAVADTVVSLINGCGKLSMFDKAHFLVQYHTTLSAAAALPPCVLGTLMARMHSKHQHKQLLALADDVLDGRLAVSLVDVQPQVWMSIFRSTTTELPRYVDRLLAWFDAVKHHEAYQLERVLGVAVQTCVANNHAREALRCFDVFTREDERDLVTGGDEHDESLSQASSPRRVSPDENIYVSVLKACVAMADDGLFRDVYARMARDGVARSAGFGMAVRFCRVHADVELLDCVLHDAFTAESKAWWLPLAQYNEALSCLAAAQEFDMARDLFSRLLAHHTLTPDHYTMVAMVDAHRAAPVDELFALMDVFLRCDVRPNAHVFTSLLAACGQHRLLTDATALFAAMKREGCACDVKTYTAVAFVYATHAHVRGIVELLREMRESGVEDDDRFYETVLRGLHDGHGVDLCFALVSELHAAELVMPERMYRALVALGTDVGLVGRTLHLAYNMECDGFAVAEGELLALAERCASEDEVLELARIVGLLHQGRRREDDSPPRFSIALYEELVDVMTRYSLRSAAAEIQRLAQDAGYAV